MRLTPLRANAKALTRVMKAKRSASSMPRTKLSNRRLVYCENMIAVRIGGPKARDTHPQRKNFKATAKLTTLQISMLPSSQPSELKVAPSNMTLRMASIKGVSGRIRR